MLDCFSMIVHPVGAREAFPSFLRMQESTVNINIGIIDGASTGFVIKKLVCLGVIFVLILMGGQAGRN